MNPIITNMNVADPPYLKFTLSGVDVSLANAMRRIILAEIPTVVFRTTPHEKNLAKIEINTSRLNNELIKQRLSCIPVHITDTAVPIENYQMEVDKKNNTDTIEYVTTADFKIKDLQTDKYLTAAAVKKIFPPDSFTGDYIDFVRLRPRISDQISGEHLKLTCKFDFGTAQQDSAFNVVSTCAYAFTPDTNKIKELWEAKANVMMTSGYAKEDIAFAEKDWLLLEAKRCFQQNSFDFIIESVGPFTETEIIYKTTQIMISKLEKFKNTMQTEQDLISASDATIDNSFDITIPHEGYTLGKVMEYMLYSKYYTTGVLTYCGFRKPHPHIDICKIRLGFKTPIEKPNMVGYLLEAADAAIQVYQTISAAFIE